jgi:Rrf2 family protein
MSAIFSRSCEYGIQAVLFLAKNATAGAPLHLRTISSGLKVPHHFLSKVLQTLVRDGIVLSHKGQTGGFKLGRPASEITLAEIVEAIDGKGFLDRCVLGFSKCSGEEPCPAHEEWKPAKQMILGMLQAKTIDHLSRGLDDKFSVPGAGVHTFRARATA